MAAAATIACQSLRFTFLTITMPAEIEMQDLKATDNRQETESESESEDVRDYTITTWAWVATTLYVLLHARFQSKLTVCEDSLFSHCVS